MLTLDYDAIANRTASTAGSKPKAQRNNNWAWRPPKEDGKRVLKSGFKRDRLDALCGAVQPKQRYAKRYAVK